VLTTCSDVVQHLFSLPFSPMSSASTPSPSSTSPGKCVVCGRETWTRCSACSSAGSDWMCFCSIEHQRIVSAASSHLASSPKLTDSTLWLRSSGLYTNVSAEKGRIRSNGRFFRTKRSTKSFAAQSWLSRVQTIPRVDAGWMYSSPSPTPTAVPTETISLNCA